MILTAKEMHNSPAQAYREADKGETVVINHDRYPDKVFELTARDRMPLSDIDLIDAQNKMKIIDRRPENKWRHITPKESEWNQDYATTYG